MRGLTVCLLLISCGATQPPAGHRLVSQLIDALNTRDRAQILAFARAHASADRSPEDRADRLLGVAEQGAPFRLIGFLPDTAGAASATIEDREKTRLGLRVDFKPASGADPKLAMLRIGPEEEMTAPPPKDYSGWQELGKLTEAIRQDTGNPAMAIAVVAGGKLDVAVRGVRQVGGTDAVGVDEPWSVGSIGKPICSTVIARLIETGKLDWGTTLGQALAGLPMRDEYRAVTLEDLMHHRGGIPADLGMRKDEIDRLVGSATTPVQIRENYARDVLGRAPIGKPGEKFAYSNAGYALLGVVAERAAGKPYETLVKELVFAPLGLQHSFTGADTLPRERPSGHTRPPGGKTLEPMNFEGAIEILFAPAGGGIFMSVADLARFGEAHLRGLRGEDGPLLKAATIERLHRGIPEAGPQGRRYACGWGIEDFPGIETLHTHNGSNGTMRAQLALFKDANLVVAAFVNAGGEAEPAPPLQAILAIARRLAPR